MTQPPGWYPDPYGRYRQRYHDGTAWTAHVHDGDAQLVDPMGSSPVVPIAGPFAVPAPSAAPASGGALRRFLDGLGPDAKVRPRPDVTVALAGIGGVLVALGVLALAVDIDSLDDFGDVRGKLAILSVLVLAAVYAVRLFVRHQRELASAAVGAGAVGIFGLGAAITYTSSSQTLPLLVLAAMYLAAWIAPGLRGRPLLLGLAALALVSSLSSIADGQEINVGIGAGSSGGSGQGIVFLVAGAVLLGAVFLLDRAGYAGVATSVLVAALIATFAGAFQVVGSLGDATGGAFVMTLVGLVVCIVGTHGHRRASVWLGAAVAGTGTAVFLFSVTEPSSVAATAGTFVLAGALLLGGALLFELIRAANRDAPAPPPSNLPPPPSAA
jgi:hypothetical protein